VNLLNKCCNRGRFRELAKVALHSKEKNKRCLKKSWEYWEHKELNTTKSAEAEVHKESI
jgi:hypothetical protein